MDPLNPITYFAETDARNKKIKFGIKAKDRLRHTYVIGKTGMGKSTLLENLAIQDIQNGEGLAVIDPHGSFAEKLLDYIPEHRVKDVLYFAPFDMEYPIAFNVMEDVNPDKRHLVVNGLMATFEKIWADAWSARMSYILQYAIIALLEYPNSSLLSINKMLSDKEYRKKVVDNITDASAKSFWVDEFGKYTEKFAAEATPAIQNKVGQFTSNALVRNIIGQSKSSFDVREMMDTKKILIINLSKGQVGELNARLIGSMLITKIYLAAMSRADLKESDLNKLPNFYLYVDEFQSFANKSFADILSEARKYKLSLTVAHQYVEQMEEEVRDAVFGNVGTMITFRVGAMDAELLEKEFSPVFTAEDLVNLGFAQIYLKLMIDGTSSTPFSATTLFPIAKPAVSFKEQALAYSRQTYGRIRQDVENDVTKFFEDGRTIQPQRSNNDGRNNNYDGGGNRGQSSPQYGGSFGNRNQGYGTGGGQGQTGGVVRQIPSPVEFRAPLTPERELGVGGVESRSQKSEARDPNKMVFEKAKEELEKQVGGVKLEAGIPKLDEIKMGMNSGEVKHEAPNLNVTGNKVSSFQASNFQPQSSKISDENRKLESREGYNANNGGNKIFLKDLRPEHEKAKVPTKENVNSLKDALAMVMAKKGGEVKPGDRMTNNEVRSTNNTKEEERKTEARDGKFDEIKMEMKPTEVKQVESKLEARSLNSTGDKKDSSQDSRFTPQSSKVAYENRDQKPEARNLNSDEGKGMKFEAQSQKPEEKKYEEVKTEKKPDDVAKNKEPQQQPEKKFVPQASSFYVQSSGTREVPEDVLRQLLQVDEPKMRQ